MEYNYSITVIKLYQFCVFVLFVLHLNRVVYNKTIINCLFSTFHNIHPGAKNLPLNLKEIKI